MRSFSRALGITVALVLMLPGVAHAAPIRVQRDATDNSHSFAYNAVDGEITNEWSSRIITRSDKVSFMVMVRENAEAEVGKRLKANVSLALSRRVERAMRYSGTFTLRVRDNSGNLIYTDSVWKRITLRPRDGYRRASFSFLFDLPTGSYYARVGFRTPS